MKKFKLVTLLGIRPDIIRMHKLIRLLDEGQKLHDYEHLFVHSGQHFDYELDEIFYKELSVRLPDVNFHIGKILKESGGPTDFVYQTGLLFQKTAQFIESYRPDAVIFLGDTNTILTSMIVARYAIPVIHIEGGGRSFDWRMPEEKCRIIIDHLSDVVYCYLPRYRKILLQEGIPYFRIKVIGNIIDDAVKRFLPISENSKVLEQLKVRKKSYALVTLHREENTSKENIFYPKLMDLMRLAEEMPVIFPIMPRVRAYINKSGLAKKFEESKIIKSKPLGFLDFLHLENYAKVVITDSGTVQEETLILGVPCLVSRLCTERPETIRAGATIMADDDLYKNTFKAIKLKTDWDKTILNPFGTSPSEVVYEDLIKKINSKYFENSRKFSILSKNHFVQEAYGIK